MRWRLYRASPGLDFFAVRDGDLRLWSDAQRAGLVEIGAYGAYRLLRESPH